MKRNSSLQSGLILRLILVTAFFCSMAKQGLTQSIPGDDLFLGQVPPGNTPKIFPLSVTKGFFAAERIAISPDGKNIYYSEIKSYYPIRGENIKKFNFSDGKWTGPFDLFVGYAPALSVSGDTIYFERKDLENNSETYISVLKGEEWGNPKRILTSLDKAHYCQITSKDNYYISTKSGKGEGMNDWCRVVINGTDTTASSLGKPLNTGMDNLDFYIDRTESYIIISTPVGLAVSFRKKDRTWTNPVNLGRKINFGLGMWGPWVSADNRYLFYSTGTKPDYSDVHVHWIRIDNLIDSLKKKCPDSSGLY